MKKTRRVIICSCEPCLAHSDADHVRFCHQFASIVLFHILLENWTIHVDDEIQNFTNDVIPQET